MPQRKSYAASRKTRAPVVRVARHRQQASRVPRPIGQSRPRSTFFRDVVVPGLGMIPGIGGIASNAASLIGKLTGLGDYKFGYNSIMKDLNPSSMRADYVPVVDNLPHVSGTRIRHREFITDILGSITFANNSYQINPSNGACFPWLSKIALQYQQYRMHGMIFEFKTTSGDSLTSTNTALGTVIMSTDYNPSSANFLSKQAAENSEYANSMKPSESMIHGIECDPGQTNNRGLLFVNPNGGATAPTGEDIKQYMLGNFQLMTTGMQAAAVIGELWVSYDVELIKPTSLANVNIGQQDHFNLATCTSTNLLGTTRSALFSTLGCVLTATTITLPSTIQPGQIYILQLSYVGSASSGAVARPGIAATSLTALSVWQNDVVAVQSNVGVSDTMLQINIAYQVAATYLQTAPAVITFSTGSVNLPGGTVGADLIITGVAGNYK